MSFDFIQAHRVKPGSEVKLDKIGTDTEGPFGNKDEAREFLREAVAEIDEYQYKMFTEAKRSLLIVLQAPDAAGKDGLIRKSLGQMNPQGCRTYPFKVPTEVELAHDFLWRIHQAVPAKGMISIFNRSHYEEVLVVRVEEIVPKAVWSQRYEIINQFESLLATAGTRILKFYLHISAKEQLKRFGERLEQPSKHWKLNAGDYTSRLKWEAYRKAYEDAIEKCSADHAPWHIIPADNKWYRDAAVAGIVLDEFKAMDPQWPKVTADLAEIRRLYEEAVAQSS
jgi:PPK2 family polyphosphate:nucleotide phosphotransferase